MKKFNIKKIIFQHRVGTANNQHGEQQMIIKILLETLWPGHEEQQGNLLFVLWIE